MSKENKEKITEYDLMLMLVVTAIVLLICFSVAFFSNLRLTKEISALKSNQENWELNVYCDWTSIEGLSEIRNVSAKYYNKTRYLEEKKFYEIMGCEVLQ